MKRPLALIGITYLISLTFLNFIPNKLTNYLACVFVLLFFISLIFKKLRTTWALPLCFAVCIISTIVHNFNTSNVENIQKWIGQEHIASGKIYDIPYKQNNHYEYTIKIDLIDNKPINPFLVSLKTDSALEGDIYSKITGKIKFEFISKNSKMYYNAKNIFVLGKLNKNQIYKIEDLPDTDWRYYILKLRQKIISIPKEFLNSEICSVTNGILIGEKNEIPENIKKDFQKIGVYHLLATSGIHVVIISQFIFYIFKKLKIKEKSAALFSSLAMVLFMAIVGFTPSVTRACLMTIIYFLGICISKTPDSINSLGITILIICALNPFAACDIGLWLSFLATLGIILGYNPIKEYIYKKIKLKKTTILDYIISTLSVTLCVFIFTLPIAILKFKKISLISPISNLIFIPGVNIILSLSGSLNILKIANAPTAILEPIALICGHVTNSLIKISELLASIPYASISLKYQESYIWLLLTMILIALTIMITPTKKVFAIDTLLSINLTLICIIFHQIFNHNQLDISLTYCANGICAMISQNNHLAVISCISDNSNITKISDAISDSHIKNIDYFDLYVEKNTNKSKKGLNDLICKNTIFNTALNLDSPIKIKTDKQNSVTYYKSHSKTTFWKDITITNLKIDNHMYMRIDTPKLSVLLFPNGGDAKKLPEKWKSCNILVANGLPLNYRHLNFKQAIISSNFKDSSVNISKLINHSKNVFSLYDENEIHIKINPNGNYKLRRLC